MIINRKIIILLLFLPLSFLSYSETTIIKNATLFLPDNTYQADSYIILNGCKIEKIGLMKTLQKNIFDIEFDAKGGFVYPAFIDPFYKGLQKKEIKKKKESSSRDKTVRKSFEERNYLIKRNVIDKLTLTNTKSKRLISQGFTCLHIIPEKGIIGGTTGIISLVSEKLKNTVLIPEKFMALFFKTNSFAYPSTHASLIAELNQLKLDCSYYQKMKKLQFFHKSKRIEYVPEYEILYPYFQKNKRFILETKNIVEQRMFELIKKDLKVNPVMVAHPDIWRRKVDRNTDIILPLSFKPPLSSKYSNMGEKAKKEAEKKIYPEKIAEFFKTHKNISLSAPDNGDYKKLFKNIKILLKKGVNESEIIKSLTINPAKLLGISKYTGSIIPGKLASLILADKKIFEDKVKIKRVFVEGKSFEIKEKDKKIKPPITDITGTWIVKVESPMGNFELKMTVEQEGNDFSGKLTFEMGTMDIEDGLISGDEISFSTSAPIGGQDTKIKFSGKIKDKKMTGTLDLGSLGKGTLVATPEQTQGALQ